MKKTHAIANQLLHHPSTIVITLLSTMVAIMLSYNIIMRYGISWHVFSTILILYPFVVVFIYSLRRYVTLPLVTYLHQYFPKIFKTWISAHVSVPFFVIAANVTVMMSIFTETHRHMYPVFFTGFLSNWAKTFFVAIPVFFFIARPTVVYIFKRLQIKYPLPTILEPEVTVINTEK